MDLHQAERYLKLATHLGAIDCLLIGGEPTLYPQLEELINHGPELGIGFKLVTNGRRLSNHHYLEALIRAGLKHVSISIEGATSETHNGVTRANSFTEVITSINNCIDMGISFNTLLTISRHNKREVIELARILHQMGVKNILYNIGLPSPGTTEETGTDEFVLTPREAASIIKEAYWTLRNEGIKVKFFATIPLCLLDAETLTAMLSDGSISNGEYLTSATKFR